MAFSSCDKEKLSSMTAKVDGKDWSVTIGSVVGATYSGYMTIAGINLNGQKIFLTIKGEEPGTYSLKTLEGESDQISFYLTDSDDADDGTKKYVSSSGEVIIDSMDDNRISGTFQFNGLNSLSDQVEVTEGVFTNVLVL